MHEVAIVADDLTGAADAALSFALAGLSTYVSLGAGTPPASAHVVSVDTDSRALPAGEAAARVFAAARAAYAEGARTFYKKIDSTLRGHVGVEIAAAVRATTEARGRTLAVIAPAFPGAGRTVRGGGVRVDGVPLEQTEIWRASGRSGPADLASLLAQAGLRAARATSGGGFPPEAEAVICDAQSDDDLARIARTFAALPLPVVWVGSAGLARHLPAALGFGPRPAAAARVRPGTGPVLTLVGSRSSIAHEQARALAADEGVASVLLDAETLAAGESRPAWGRAAAALEAALAAGRDALLEIELGEAVDPGRARVLAAALGRLAAAHAGRLGGLVATGGDIARAALAAMGVSGLFLEAEVEPGIPIGLTDAARPLCVVTKAGAFGTPTALRRCRDALRRGRR